MNTKKIFPLILFLILIQQSLAQTQINIYLSETGEAKFYGKTTSNISLPEGIFITKGKIFGTTNILTKKEGELWFFNYSLENSSLNLILPEGAVIKELKKGEISLEGDSFSIFNKESIELCYILKKSTFKFFYFVILGAVLLILLFFLIFYNKIKDLFKKKEDLEIIQKVLNERENLIIETLKKVKEIKQARLSKITQIPKASLFRYLINLEKKGIVKRIGEGKNKIVTLK